MGIRITDLEQITIGELFDILIESGNDSYEYPVIATKADFERF